MHLKSACIAAFAVLSGVQAAPTGSSSVDFCQLAAQQGNVQLNTTGWIDYHNAVGCITSFPLNKAIRDATLDTVEKTILGQYSFTDMAAVASTIDKAQWDLQDIDLPKAMKAAYKKNYATDKEFHDELTILLRQLGDAHTGYRHAGYHATFAFYQPWGFDVIVDSKTHEQYVKLAAESPVAAGLGPAVAADFYAKVAKAIGRDPKELVGWKVLEIDGHHPIKYVEKWADTKVGLAKAANQRFNVATGRITVQKNGDIAKSFGTITVNSNMEAPEQPHRKLKLQSPDGSETVTVDAPWIARHRLGASTPVYTDKQSFYTNICLAPPKEKELKKRSLTAQTAAGFDFYEEQLEQAVTLLPNTTFPTNIANAFGNGYPKILKAGDWGSYSLLTPEIGVTSLPTFSSDDPSGPFGPVAQACLATLADKEATANIGTGGPAGPRFYCFIKEIHEGLSILKKAGAKKVILDWTNNGGGWGDLGFAYIAVMFPGVERDVASFRMTPLFTKLIAKAFELDRNETTPLTMFGPANFLDPKTARAPLPTDVDRFFLDPKAGRYETYGPYTSRYSNLINIVDGGAMFNQELPHNVWAATGIKKPTEPMWDPKNVMLLTNGFCGSTCAHAARVAVDHVGIRSTVKGGTAGSKPFPFSAFPGGNVVDIEQIFSDPTKIDMANDPLTPQPFDANIALFRVNAGVGYSARTDLPAEYAYKPADCRIDITESTIFPANAWLEAAKTFDGCQGQTHPPTPPKCHPKKPHY
ncbi:hypothetical protein DFJ77DRAFT_456725 [Powellomyces hirtus]|nr:hypothetical protein DFJ77DRAFT_456725 [Powellomyces hirtus]